MQNRLTPTIACFFLFAPLLIAQETSTKSVKAEPLSISFELVTWNRVTALEESVRNAWKKYLERSLAYSSNERHILESEVISAGLSASRPAPANSKEFELGSKVEAAWLRSPETQVLAKTMLSYQTPTGGWSKAIDYAKGSRAAGTHWTSQSGKGWHYCGTLDNRATTEQIRFLAWMNSVEPSDDCRTGAERGLRWVLDAQFPNGGWPQVYPLESGYHEAITLNDDAMLHAIQLLLAVSEKSPPFEWVDESLRSRVEAAATKGIECLLRAQVVIDGNLTVWCAQHDPITLEPVAARKKEPPSLSGGESANIVKFLMREAPDTPAIRKSISAAVAWFEQYKVTGLRQTKNEQGKTDYIPDSTSTEVRWARFYDLKTLQPIFAGGQDGVIYNSFSEMAKNNKVGYDYFTARPGDIISKEVERWKKRKKE